MKPCAPQGAEPQEVRPAERIRLRIDAGFSAVEHARQARQAGSSVAAAQAVEEVARIISEVKILLPLANLNGAQTDITHKKLQALKESAERVAGVPR